MKKFYTKMETLMQERNTIPTPAAENAPFVFILSKSGDTRYLLSTFVKIWNLRVKESENVAELLNSAESENLAMVLLDLSISFNKDLEKIKYIREFYTSDKLPILVISGHAKPEHSAAALLSGANDYLVKPLDFEKLENSVKKYVSGAKVSIQKIGGLQ